MVNSFDVFDTIIGRLCLSGPEIFSIIEDKKNLKNFKQNRIKYEQTEKNFDKIYEKLSIIYNMNLDKIKNFEKELEYELSFPIIKYLSNIQDIDILISDMYLSDIDILKIINKHKYVNNKLYVSYGGKADCSIWRNIEITKNISKHFGDNIVSDYNNPLKYNIQAQHIRDTLLTSNEKLFGNINKYYGYIIRAVRLSMNKYNNDNQNYMKFVFYEFVLPFSILVCFKIRKICIEHNLDSVIFLSRDGYWFHELYKILFPTHKVYYIYFSRLFKENNEDYIKNEINNIIGDKLVFDLQGSGKTFNSMNLENCKYLMCFISNNKYKFCIFSLKNEYEIIREVIEYLYIAPHGSVHSYNNKIINLLPPEYELNILQPYFDGLKLFKNYFSILKKYINLDDVNYNNIDIGLHNICINKNYRHIKTIINHVNFHDRPYTKHSLKFYSQIEQDKYYIENIINYKPNGVFLEIGAYDGITGSNTYFLEKNLNWEGIIIECNPIMVQKCREYRNCIICDKAIYKESNKEIEIIIPEGKEIVGGKEQLAGIKEYIKPESLNAFKDSYKQQKTINVKTININDLLEQNNIYEIDYVSLDIEGYELEVLKSWDFKNFRVKYLTIEHGNVARYQKEIREFLLTKGFSFSRNNKWDDEYIFYN